MSRDALAPPVIDRAAIPIPTPTPSAEAICREIVVLHERLRQLTDAVLTLSTLVSTLLEANPQLLGGQAAETNGARRT